MRYLGIDYGEKRIGFALSDELNQIALPLKQIENQGTQNLIKAIKEIHMIDPLQGLVLGLPLKLSGEDRPLSEKIRSLSEVLKKELNVHVYLEDERLTSREVTRDLIQQADLSRGKRKKILDQMAATKLLQTFLDRLK